MRSCSKLKIKTEQKIITKQSENVFISSIYGAHVPHSGNFIHILCVFFMFSVHVAAVVGALAAVVAAVVVFVVVFVVGSVAVVVAHSLCSLKEVKKKTHHLCRYFNIWLLIFVIILV